MDEMYEAVASLISDEFGAKTIYYSHMKCIAVLKPHCGPPDCKDYGHMTGNYINNIDLLSMCSRMVFFISGTIIGEDYHHAWVKKFNMSDPHFVDDFIEYIRSRLTKDAYGNVQA